MVILGNAAFWKTIVVGWRGISPTFLAELIGRSRNAPLGIIVEGVEPSVVYELMVYGFSSVASRVITLHLSLNLDSWSTSPLPDIICLFPSLENVFIRSTRPIELNILPFRIQSQLKELKIRINRLTNLANPGQFRELRWLSLSYERISIFSILEALQNLPSLQHLYLIGPKHYLETETEDIRSVLTMPELTVLISNCSILHLIDAPKLSYIDVSAVPSTHFFVKEVYSRLCGFDFSKITHIYFNLQVTSTLGTSRIAGRLIDESWMSPVIPNRMNWGSFDIYRDNSSFERIFNESPTTSYYQNEFNLSFLLPPSRRTPALIPILALYLEKATNLVGVVLHGVDFSLGKHPEVDPLLKALKSAITVRSLSLSRSSSRSFKGICDLLLDDDELLPRLERLSFTVDYNHHHIEEEEMTSSDILNFLRKLKRRSLSHQGGLEVELETTVPIRSPELEEIEELGSIEEAETWGIHIKYLIHL